MLDRFQDSYGDSLLSAREILAAHGGDERARFGGTIPFCRRPFGPKAVGGSPAKAAKRCARGIGRDAGRKGRKQRSCGRVGDRLGVAERLAVLVRKHKLCHARSGGAACPPNDTDREEVGTGHDPDMDIVPWMCV